MRLVEMPEGAAEHQVACLRAVDAEGSPAGGGCPSLPDQELEGGTIVVEIFRSLPLARYRVEAKGEDQHARATEPFDTRSFPTKLAPRLDPGGPPVLRGLSRVDPEDLEGISGIRRFEVAARAEGLKISITGGPQSNAGFVFDLLGPSGLVWTKPSKEPSVTYDGPPLAPGEYVWLVRSTDPETILALPELPRLHVGGKE